MIGPVEPEAGDRAEHQRRIVPPQRLVTDAEPVERAALQPFDHDIGLARQLVKQRQPLRGL